MTGRHAFATGAPAPSLLLVTRVATEQALVYPPPGALLCGLVFRNHLSSPCLPFAFASLLPCLLARALTGSVAIGRVCQTR
jgi:hypothetical protein